MRECDNSKIHISSNFLLSICLIIMLDTLLLVPSLHCNTSPHFTKLHFTTLIDTSLPLIYTTPFSVDIRKMLIYRIWRKSFQWEPTCSIRTDGQMDMTTFTVSFRDFVNVPKNSTFWPQSVLINLIHFAAEAWNFVCCTSMPVYIPPWRWTSRVRNM